MDWARNQEAEADAIKEGEIWGRLGLRRATRPGIDGRTHGSFG